MNFTSQIDKPAKAFLCHSSKDSSFVIEVAKHLERNLDGIYYYEEYQRSNESYIQTINRELRESNIMIIFVGASQLSKFQMAEINTACSLSLEEENENRHFFVVLLPGQEEVPQELTILRTYQRIKVKALKSSDAYQVAKEIVHDHLKRSWNSDDDLPLNPHLFDYEKDIIEYFIDKARLDNEIHRVDSLLEQMEKGKPEYDAQLKIYRQLQQENEAIRNKQLEGCPSQWPDVIRWDGNLMDNLLDPRDVGNFRSDDARVVAAALSKYHCEFCMREKNLSFLEAGPRAKLAYPLPGRNLNVAIIVSGGIAPGINAVIDGITQRHYMYAKKHNYRVKVYGIKDGFQAFDNFSQSHVTLIPTHDPLGMAAPLFDETSSHVSEGGSILGTSRFEGLINPDTRKKELENIVALLFDNRIDILYVIGGDGSMKAAHAIWSFAQEFADQRGSERKLSVVAVPKSMDNDILWVWQTFGFLSAVERARELIEHLSTEVRSNPRLGVVQLFGSDSGFVVSHAVLASRTGICDAALIPEIDFSMQELARYLKKRMCERHSQMEGGRIPYGFVVLSETAIPTDAMEYIDDPDIGLSEQEKEAVKNFNEKRATQIRLEGQTDDTLRTAGLKIVSRGLLKLLPTPRINIDFNVQPDWKKLRVFTNEPRHLLRATPPRSADIITAQRLGILAVDNALAGYTDFMVSQWLTEYVLVPLKLVVLGRKRIPKEGIFWKSVLAKTEQPFDLT